MKASRQRRRGSDKDRAVSEAEPRFTAYPLTEYPRVRALDFPPQIPIAFAVCGKTCGVREFIVDGSTQVCRHCGRLMFRTEVRWYALRPVRARRAPQNRKRKRT